MIRIFLELLASFTTWTYLSPGLERHPFEMSSSQEIVPYPSFCGLVRVLLQVVKVPSLMKYEKCTSLWYKICESMAYNLLPQTFQNSQSFVAVELSSNWVLVSLPYRLEWSPSYLFNFVQWRFYYDNLSQVFLMF